MGRRSGSEECVSGGVCRSGPPWNLSTVVMASFRACMRAMSSYFPPSLRLNCLCSALRRLRAVLLRVRPIIFEHCGATMATTHTQSTKLNTFICMYNEIHTLTSYNSTHAALPEVHND